MLEQLDKRRIELLRELKALDAARAAFVKALSGGARKVSRKVTMVLAPPKPKPMSKAHRRKLSLAAKKRWAERRAKKPSEKKES